MGLSNNRRQNNTPGRSALMQVQALGCFTTSHGLAIGQGAKQTVSQG
jgi:hypothetical protein